MYWNYDDWKQTREKQNPVSKWWGKKYKSTSIFAYIDAKVQAIVREYEPVNDFDLGFESL